MHREGDPTSESIRVLLTGQRPLFMEALRLTLEREPDIEVVGAAGGGVAIAQTVEHRPDVVILTDPIPGIDAAEATALIRGRSSETKVLLLCNGETPSGLAAALRAGAAGFLNGRSELEDLITATRAVHRGEVLVPPGMLRSLLDDLMRPQAESVELLPRLTRREQEVLALISVGTKNEAIAEALVISPHTARAYVRNIYSKLGVHSRIEATEVAMRGATPSLPQQPLSIGS